MKKKYIKGIKDRYGNKFYGGCKFTFSFGIPPILAEFKVYFSKKNLQYWCKTKDGNPRKIELSWFLDCQDEIEIINN